MKTRSILIALMLCVLSLAIPNMANLHKVSAQPVTDCRKLVTGTYLTTLSGSIDSFREIITLSQDNNIVFSSSNQSNSPSVQPYGNTRGNWKCISNTEIIATSLNFRYPTETLPVGISRNDFRATLDPKTGTLQATGTLKLYELDANPLKDDAPVAETFTFTGLRIKTGQ
ncbi:MAG: hypothetical protein PUP91_19505 [Rhizonema sp. PD37]|nr:hypothetical protein [Rhizonema sp. PD37]